MEPGRLNGKLWYEIGHRRPTPENPNAGRYYAVGCRRCKAKHTFAPNSQSDDNLRKVMIRQGWELAREGWNHHLCPTCQEQIKAKRKAEAERAAEVKIEARREEIIDPATMATPVLVELWRDASEQDRKDFIEWMRPTAPTLWGFKYIPPTAPTPPTLYKLWNQVSDSDRKDFMREVLKENELKLVSIYETPPDKLFDAWGRASDDERKALITVVVERDHLKVLPLVEHWAIAATTEREGLLRYLEQASIHNKTLIERWDVATGKEREELVNKRVMQRWKLLPKPRPEPTPAPSFINREEMDAFASAKADAPAIPDKIKCSFCGKPSDQVATLITSPGANICNNCIGICAGTVARASNEAVTQVAAPVPLVTKPPPEPTHIMRKGDFARMIGVQAATVSGYLNQGMPQRIDGFLDRDAALAWIKANINKKKPAPPKPPPGVDPTPVPERPGDDTFFADINDDAAIAEMARKLFGTPTYGGDHGKG